MTLAKPLMSLGLGFFTWKTAEVCLLGDCSVNGQVIVPVHLLGPGPRAAPLGWVEVAGLYRSSGGPSSLGLLLSVGPELRTQRWLPQNRTAPLPLSHSVPCP